LTVLEDKLNEISYKNLYTVPGYRSGAVEYIVQTEKSTFADAVITCTNQNLKLFTVKPGLELATFFTRYDITQAWVDLYYSKEHTRLLDTQNNSPIFLSGSSVIAQDLLISSTMPATKRISITKNASSKFEYVASDASEKMTVICTRELNFPYTEQAIKDLDRFKTDVKGLLTQRKNAISSYKEKIESQKSFLTPFPKVDKSFVLKNTVDRQTKFEEKTTEIKNALTKIVDEMSSWVEIPSFFKITVPLEKELNRIEELTDEILNLFDSPLRLFEYLVQPSLQTFTRYGQIPIELYTYENDYLVIRVGNSDIFSDDVLISDAYDFLQLSNNLRIQIMDLILFILSGLGISAGAVATIITVCCRSKLSNSQKVFLDTVIKRQGVKNSMRQKAGKSVAVNISSLFSGTGTESGSGSATGTIPKRRAPIPTQRAISHRIHVGETKTNEIRPTAPPLPVLNKPTTVQEITELVTLIRKGEQCEKPKRILPIQDVMAKSKDKEKSKQKYDPKRALPLWMESSDSD
jgi:hypothetical protein